jgi:hypothetical protein
MLTMDMLSVSGTGQSSTSKKHKFPNSTAKPGPAILLLGKTHDGTTLAGQAAIKKLIEEQLESCSAIYGNQVITPRQLHRILCHHSECSESPKAAAS